MDKQTFEDVIAEFRFSRNTKDQLEAVLVKGEAAAVVASRCGISSKTLSQKVRKVKRELQHRRVIRQAATVSSDPAKISRFLDSRFGV